MNKSLSPNGGSSLKTGAGLVASAESSKETWHPIDLNLTLSIDIVFFPESWEVSLNVSLSLTKMGLGNLSGYSLGVLLVNPEVTIWLSAGLSLSSVVSVQGVHKSVIGLSLESVWDISHVGVISSETVHPVWVLLFLLIIIELNEFLVFIILVVGELEVLIILIVVLIRGVIVGGIIITAVIAASIGVVFLLFLLLILIESLDWLWGSGFDFVGRDHAEECQ